MSSRFDRECEELRARRVALLYEWRTLIMEQVRFGDCTWNDGFETLRDAEGLCKNISHKNLQRVQNLISVLTGVDRKTYPSVEKLNSIKAKQDNFLKRNAKK